MGLGSAPESIVWANLLRLFSTGTSVGDGGEGLRFRNVFIAFVTFLFIIFLNFPIEVFL